MFSFGGMALPEEKYHHKKIHFADQYPKPKKLQHDGDTRGCTAPGVEGNER